VWSVVAEPGRVDDFYAEVVARQIRDAGAELVTVMPRDPEGVEGFDAADALAQNWDADRVDAQLRQATIAGEKPAPKKGHGRRRKGPPPQRDQLIELVRGAELWHDEKQVPYITIEINGHFENWPVRSEYLRSLLHFRFLKANTGGPGSQAVEETLKALIALAVHEGPQYRVFLRTASHQGKNYLDLCNAAWSAIEIDAQGWRVVAKPPVKFIRNSAMQALPDPEQDDRTIDQMLDPFINTKSQTDRMLIVAWLVAALHPQGPFGVLAINGEPGTAKSSTCEMLRALVDPNVVMLRGLPKDDAALWVGTDNCWMLAFDNVSFIADWLSDSMCRVATGGGMTVRALYKDREEEIFTAIRPVLFNGIGSLANRSDLADRVIVCNLDVISPDRRRPKEEIWGEFLRERPKILGALLNASSAALRNIDAVKLETYARMADFEKLIVAAAPGLGWDDPKEFLEAFRQNRNSAAAAVFEADEVAVAIFDFIQSDDWRPRDEDDAIIPLGAGQPVVWKGSATQLLAALNARIGEKRAKERGWPQNAAALTSAPIPCCGRRGAR
jgi:putative DNA primase/helicase